MRLAATALALFALLTGCGNSDPSESKLPASEEVAKAFQGSPPKLAALHREANQLMGGSEQAFRERLEELRGYPVVVNKWASWCPPCRAEFPAFQEAGVKLGKQVAFLGLDGEDADSDARGFLKRFPVTYPHYRDPSARIAPKFQAGAAYPTTIFFDRRGKLIYSHPGPYDTTSELIADIRRYTK